jgi:hypothetical protein
MQNEAERVLRAMLLTCSSKAATNEGEEDEEDEEEQNKSGHLNLTVLFEKADIEEWLARILISMGDLYINQHQHQTGPLAPARIPFTFVDKSNAAAALSAYQEALQVYCELQAQVLTYNCNYTATYIQSW